MPTRNCIKRAYGAPPPQAQWLKANHAKGNNSNRAQFNAKLRSDQDITMRQALSRLQVKFNTNKATQWQRVTCPVCSSRESAKVLLHGRFGHSGGFICMSCATKGDALTLFSRATCIPKAQARALWRTQ